MKILIAGFPMAAPTVIRTGSESIIENSTCRGYLIDDGSNQYALPG